MPTDVWPRQQMPSLRKLQEVWSSHPLCDSAIVVETFQISSVHLCAATGEIARG